jgi:hypothetical protein
LFLGALYVAWVLFYVGLFSVRTFFFEVVVSSVWWDVVLGSLGNVGRRVLPHRSVHGRDGRAGSGVSEESVAFDPSERKCEDPATVLSEVWGCGGGVGDSFGLRWNGTGGGGGRGVSEGVGEGGAGGELRFGAVPAEVVLAVMVLVGLPTGFASAMPDDFNGDDGWLVDAAEKQSLASGDITGAYNVLLFATPPLSSFGGPGHPLNMAAIGDHVFRQALEFFSGPCFCVPPRRGF